jgi:hypothetical protein
MSTEGMSKRYGIWDAMVTNVKARLPEVPQFAPTIQEFEEVIGEIREIQSVQDVHRRQLRETTLRTKELEQRGRGLRNRLVAGMQSVFGVDSMVLVEFGIQPRLPTKRKRLTNAQMAEKERLEKLEKAAAEAGLKV